MSDIDVGNDHDDDDEWEDMDEDVGEEEEGEVVPDHLRPPAVAVRRSTLRDTR